MNAIKNLSCEVCTEKTGVVFHVGNREIHISICKHYSKEDLRSFIIKIIEEMD